jgi:hypothetical protein
LLVLQTDSEPRVRDGHINPGRAKGSEGEEHRPILPGRANAPTADQFLRRSAVSGIRARARNNT